MPKLNKNIPQPMSFEEWQKLPDVEKSKYLPKGEDIVIHLDVLILTIQEAMDLKKEIPEHIVRAYNYLIKGNGLK
ncbi:MAG: hypothetical protein JJE45_00455 [Prolixibacteraceae bacterium]|nr:hypothetical protein [Prolixibacteraceae bacterium]